MRIALCSDEPYPVHAMVRGRQTRSPVATAMRACSSAGTGTGISMAANTVPGIRAALCTDPGQAAGARVWNHANVLCLSNRTLADDLAKEILAAWSDTDPGEQGSAGVADLAAVDERHRRE